MSKVVLFALNASYSHTNLAVRAIGAHLTEYGMAPVLIERNLKDKRLAVLQALATEKADIYGFSVYIWNVTEMLRFAEELKILCPRSVIVFGGPEVSFADERYFAEHPAVDYIIAGEGETAFPALCEMLMRGERPPRIFTAEPFHAFEESGIYYDKIGDEPHGLVYYESVRGCPFACAYCLSSRADGIRAKTAERALADLLEFEQFDKIRTVKLVDRTFNFDRERARKIWRGLMEPQYTKEYHFEVSAALLEEEDFALLALAPKGKFRLEIGVQSTNPETIRAVGRALDAEKTLTALARLHAGGNLHLHADLIAGLPHENYALFARSFDAVYAKENVLQLGFLKLLHGSALRRDAKKYGIAFSPEPPYQVLRTNDMDFDELMRLEAISDMLERFSNSGKFAYTFPRLPLACGSPFTFFDGLCDFMRERFSCIEIARLSQTEAFRLILEYARTLPVDAEEIRGRLMVDYLLGETRRLPSFLAGEMIAAAEKAEMLAKIPQHRRAACEVVSVPFLSSSPVIIDRAAHTVITTDDQ